MKTAKFSLMVAAAAGSLVLASCGGDDSASVGPAPPPPPPTTMDLDTPAVLAIVQTMTSETAKPFAVDDAAVAVTPVGDEMSAPISVDAT